MDTKFTVFLLLAVYCAVNEAQSAVFNLTLMVTCRTFGGFLPTNRWGDLCSPGQDSRCSGGFARLANFTKHRDKNTSLLLDLGGFFWGQHWRAAFQGNVTTAIHNMIGYDAFTFRTHDFFPGSQYMAEKIIPQLRASILAPNINVSLDKFMGRQAHRLLPYKVFVMKGGQRVGVVGLCESGMWLTIAKDTLSTYPDPVNDIRRAVWRLRRLPQPPDVVIALLPVERPELERIVWEVVGVDVVLSLLTDERQQRLRATGASTSRRRNILGEPVLVVYTDAPGYAKALSLTHLSFARGGGGEGLLLASHSGGLLPLDSAVGMEADTQAFVEGKYGEMVSRLSAVLGHTAVLLDGAPSSNRFGRATNLGGLVARAIAEAGGVAVAFTNAGSLRASVQPNATITRKTVQTVVPFQDYVVTCTLSGAAIRGVLNQAVLKMDNPSSPIGAGGTLQWHGLRYQWWRDGPPGRLPFNIKQGVSGAYAPLQDSHRYRVATNSFLAGGGSGYGLQQLCGSPATLPAMVSHAVEALVQRVTPVTAAVAPSPNHDFGPRKPIALDDVCGAGFELFTAPVPMQCLRLCVPPTRRHYEGNFTICVGPELWERHYACYTVQRCGVDTTADQRKARYFMQVATSGGMQALIHNSSALSIYDALSCRLTDEHATVNGSAFTVPCHYVPRHSQLGQVVIALSAAVAAGAVVLIVLLVAQRSKPHIRQLQVVPSVLMLLGFLLALAAVLTNMDPPTQLSCWLAPALFHVAFGLVFCPLLSKTYRVWRLLDNPKMRRRVQTLSMLLLRLALQMALLLALLLLWLLLDPPRLPWRSSGSNLRGEGGEGW